MSSLLETIHSLEIKDPELTSEQTLNDEYLPSHVRLSLTDFGEWKELLSGPISNRLESMENETLLRLIMYSAYTRTIENDLEKSLVMEMINRVRLGPDARSRDLLEKMNEITKCRVRDWFHEELGMVSWNHLLPRPYIDMLQQYFRIKSLPLEPGWWSTPWARFGYIPFIEAHFEKYRDNLCEESAKHGNLHVLKWAKMKGCSWDEWTCSYAAKEGHLDILKWSRKNGCPWDEKTCTYAAINGHMDVLKWARLNGCEFTAITFASAAMNGNFEILKWLKNEGCPWDKWTCLYAAEKGNLEVLKWARENECPWDHWICSFAAKNGHLEVLKWAGKNGCPWDSTVCSSAAKSGHLEVLKWARENGCPWDEWTYIYAKEEDRTEVLKWALENGCPRSD